MTVRQKIRGGVSLPHQLDPPIVGQEQDEGRGDGDLQPAPVSDEVGQQGEDQVPDAEEHLVQDPHGASVLHPHHLCD